MGRPDPFDHAEALVETGDGRAYRLSPGLPGPTGALQSFFGGMRQLAEDRRQLRFEHPPD
jgi:hypothetical protein